jgi:hypothetical protein
MINRMSPYRPTCQTSGVDAPFVWHSTYFTFKLTSLGRSTRHSPQDPVRGSNPAVGRSSAILNGVCPQA